MRANVQQQIELLGKECIVVLEPEAEEREGLDGRAAADDHLRAAPRQQIERGEVLKRAHRVLRAQHGDRAGQPDALRPCRRSAKDDRGRGIQKLATMMFADPERVQPDLVGVFDLLHELSQPLRRVDGAAVLVEGGGETVNPNLHRRYPQKKIDRSRTKAPIQSTTIGMNGLAFSASCDSSVAIAPPK